MSEIKSKLCTDEELEAMLKSDLVKMAKRIGIPHSGTKSKLISRIIEAQKELVSEEVEGEAEESCSEGWEVDEEEGDVDEKYECPECGWVFEELVSVCPGCGTEFEGVEEKEEEYEIEEEEIIEEPEVEEPIEEEEEIIEEPEVEEPIEEEEEELEIEKDESLLYYKLNKITLCFFIYLFVLILIESIYDFFANPTVFVFLNNLFPRIEYGFTLSTKWWSLFTLIIVSFNIILHWVDKKIFLKLSFILSTIMVMGLSFAIYNTETFSQNFILLFLLFILLLIIVVLDFICILKYPRELKYWHANREKSWYIKKDFSE